MDRGAWQATVHGVAKSWTRLSMHTRATCLNRNGGAHPRPGCQPWTNNAGWSWGHLRLPPVLGELADAWEDVPL